MYKMKTLQEKLHSYWSSKRRYDRFLIIASLLYLGVIGFFLIIHQAPYSPDQFFFFALVFAILIGQGKDFLKDWTPPILLLLVYEYLRTLIPAINPHIHYYAMPKFDMFIFGGHLPTVLLQHLLYTPGYLHWYDYTSAFLYSIFFVVPLFIAFILWLVDRTDFEGYIFGMVGLSFMAYFTYLAFPAAPPWLAAQYGIIPPVTHITSVVLSHFLGFIALPTVYKYFGPNVTAAVPSLHAAYPFFTALYIGKKYPWSVWPLALYAIGVAFAVIYLGEHYFFDVVLGLLYAYIAYLVTAHWGAIWGGIKKILTSAQSAS
jgi:membrane-associated phospholipid phosphatase